ncbi:TlpA family protein disulfide reductase [Chondromyces crocatus]|uniref:Thiol-disulfide oxidoreductase n=1 Tax=Chondromyces crocatus TaxID=52 RepID=A0A0K1ECQ8_CHOCO|nr:TlpA family protein disulfide reductase [Chondromyces crocatus]AKT38363.1 Thiol-disulfide oxidoreductase [Chondromyces crocatus]
MNLAASALSPRRHLGLFTAALLALGATACDGGDKAQPEPPRPGQGRSNAVVAPSNALPAQTAAGAPGAPGTPGATAAKPPRAPGTLCTGQTTRPAPASPIATAAAPGEAALPAAIGFGVGKWVWVNFWAAWCKPCKEEMPRLLGWQQKLRSAGVLIDLAFISLDEDERQLNRFLQEQPGHGVRASYWLPEGPDRTSWLTGLGLKNPPDLPVHALVNPAGQVTCVIHGAVEDSDYPAVSAYLGAR